MTDRIGRRVGRYAIRARAAVPEPGAWYRARAEGDPEPVLVRFASPDRPDERDALRRQREVLAALDDPRLPEVVAWDEAECALALRGGLGATLHDAVALRAAAAVALTPGTLVDLLLEVGGAIGALHAAGVVHGHLAPGCVVLEEDGAVWLYGVGVPPEPPDAFLPPEIARGQAATPATDQWAVGAIGLALVLGHPPWRGPDPRAEAAAGDVARPVEAVARQWPALGHVLGRMLAAAPGARFPAIEDATDALAELAGVAGPSERESLGTALAGIPRPPSPPEGVAGGAPTAVPATDGADRGSGSWDADTQADDDRRVEGDGDDEVDDEDDGDDDEVGDEDDVDEADDPELRAELTDPIGWFQAPTPTPASSARIGADRPSDPGTGSGSLPQQRIAAAGDPIVVKLAQALAGAMVVLLVVWVVVRVL